jgi:YfiH family protein
MDRCFPELKRSQLKQTHSNTVHLIESPISGNLQGDSQVTKTPGIALTVYTADCLPLLIWDSRGKMISAIHAGWRGIENKVIMETLKKFEPSNLSNVFVWIGPHIRTESFEVGLDVAEMLEKSSYSSGVVVGHPTDPKKRMVDLTKIAISQLTKLGISPSNIWVHQEDTFKNVDYYSFRRDGKGGRLLSFISLNE